MIDLGALIGFIIGLSVVVPGYVYRVRWLRKRLFDTTAELRALQRHHPVAVRHDLVSQHVHREMQQAIDAIAAKRQARPCQVVPLHSVGGRDA